MTFLSTEFSLPYHRELTSPQIHFYSRHRQQNSHLPVYDLPQQNQLCLINSVRIVLLWNNRLTLSIKLLSLLCINSLSRFHLPDIIFPTILQREKMLSTILSLTVARETRDQPPTWLVLMEQTWSAPPEGRSSLEEEETIPMTDTKYCNHINSKYFSKI